MTDNVFGFLRKHLGKVGIFGIILAVLEKITEDDFVCPCDKTYNKWMCVLYAAVPAICCIIYTLCYMDLSPQTDGATQNNSMTNDRNVSTPPSPQTDGATENISMRNLRNDSTPPSPQTEDGATQKMSTREKVRYSILTAAIWMCLFFLDGRYVACARSTWKGVYSKNESLGILKWCKPTGNEPSVLDSQQETLKWMCKSQILGFTLMFFIAFCLLLSKCCVECCGKCSKTCSRCCYHLVTLFLLLLLLLVLVLLALFV